MTRRLLNYATQYTKQYLVSGSHVIVLGRLWWVTAIIAQFNSDVHWTPVSSTVEILRNAESRNFTGQTLVSATLSVDRSYSTEPLPLTVNSVTSDTLVTLADGHWNPYDHGFELNAHECPADGIVRAMFSHLVDLNALQRGPGALFLTRLTLDDLDTGELPVEGRAQQVSPCTLPQTRSL
jgi:hypothetical protein